MKRTTAIGATLVLIALPGLLAMANAVSFHVHNRNNGSIVSAGVRREYLLHLPAGYDRTKPVPLVISLHGAGGWPVQQMEATGWNALADREGFIVAYPSGSRHGGPRIWRESEADVRFLSDLIDRLESEHTIDPDRIYVNGLSNGGGMSFVLSCTLSDRIAAVGLVGTAQMLPWSWCGDRRPIPMIAFHGTADSMAPYDGGISWVAPTPFLSIPRFTKGWARRNGCAASATDLVIATDVTRREYTRCANDASVVLYTIRGGGHTWPGHHTFPVWFAGSSTDSIDATSEMWAFFRDHPRTKILRAIP